MSGPIGNDPNYIPTSSQLRAEVEQILVQSKKLIEMKEQAKAMEEQFKLKACGKLTAATAEMAEFESQLAALGQKADMHHANAEARMAKMEALQAKRDEMLAQKRAILERAAKRKAARLAAEGGASASAAAAAAPNTPCAKVNDVAKQTMPDPLTPKKPEHLHMHLQRVPSPTQKLSPDSSDKSDSNVSTPRSLFDDE